MAGLIPQEFIDELLGRVDIVELIDARIPLRKAGREFAACCPFHNERTPSFFVSPVKQFFHCFGCGAHGTALSFLMDYEHLGFREAVEDLARLAGLEVPEAGRGPKVASGLLELVAQADGYFRRQLRKHPQRQQAVDYLRQRGLDGETAAAFGIGFAPAGWQNLTEHLRARGARLEDLLEAGLSRLRENGEGYDIFRNRIIFPIRDRRGRTVAFGGRALGEEDRPKYLNSPESPMFRKGQELYGLFEARTRNRRLERLLVVEGYMDVVGLARHGLGYTVATLGTSATADHMERLFRVVREVVFCFDGDEAGRKAAWRALENVLSQLRDGRQVSFLFLPEGEDPDSLVRREGREAFEALLAQSRPLAEYLFDRLTQQVDMTSLDGRARLGEQARALIDRVPDGVYRDLLIRRLGELTGLDRQDIERRLTVRDAPSSRRKAKVNIGRTPVRAAIALLLNDPGLAARAGDMERFKGLKAPGVPLLVQLIEILSSSPHLNTAALLERFRGTEVGPVLERLAQWRLEGEEEKGFDAQKEFLGALKQLDQRYNPHWMLLDKAARGELSPEEKEMLRNFSRKIPART